MDALFSSIQTLNSAMNAQAERIKIETQNIANKDSISSTPGGVPYIRKTLFFKSCFDPKTKTETVKVSKHSVDKKSPFRLKFDPNHPLSNAEGYVVYPNVDPTIAMSNFKEAKNSYQLSLATLSQSINMLNKLLSIISK